MGPFAPALQIVKHMGEIEPREQAFQHYHWNKVGSNEQSEERDFFFWTQLDCYCPFREAINNNY